MSTRDDGATPSLTEVIEEMIEDRLYSLNTIMPGTITSVDKARGLVGVKPDFMRLYNGSEEPTEYPVIEGVPLWELRANKAKVRMPVKVGDKCILLFSQRSLDKWKARGGPVRPGDSRIHALSDAVCIPGLYPVSGAAPALEELSIEFGKAIIKLKEDEMITVQVANATLQMNKEGKFKISNGSSELLTLLKELMTAEEEVIKAVQKMTFPTSLGPTGTVIDPSPFMQAGQEIAKIRKKLTQMILE